jgi:hypothetical protein
MQPRNKNFDNSRFQKMKPWSQKINNKFPMDEKMKHPRDFPGRGKTAHSSQTKPQTTIGEVIHKKHIDTWDNTGHMPQDKTNWKQKLQFTPDHDKPYSKQKPKYTPQHSTPHHVPQQQYTNPHSQMPKYMPQNHGSDRIQKHKPQRHQQNPSPQIQHP